MRRSAAPSQTSCGVPLAKRPRFHTPFAAKDGEGCSSDQSVAVDTCTSLESRHIDEEYGGSDSSALQRVLQDIRKQHPVDKECDTTATLSTEAGTRDVRSGDKENAAPTESREENPFALSESPSPSAGCTSTNTSCVDVKQPTGLKVTSNPVFTEQGTKVKPKLGMRRGGFKAPTRPPGSSQGPPVAATHGCGGEPSGVGCGDNKSDWSVNGCKYYNVMWCKLSKKKHKKWEGDAILIVNGGAVSLKDMDGKEIGRGAGYKRSELSALVDGSTLVVGGKELEIGSELSEDMWKSGKCFTGASCETTASIPQASPCLSKPKSTKKFVNPSLNAVSAVQKNPALPLHNPSLPNALVMPRPDSKHQLMYNHQGLQLVDVVVDPHLSVHLRPHQREGVVFLYECVTGMKDYSGLGAILADEMGLGKTLQCIATLWTLYKQGPYDRKPLVKKALIITPGSLVKNWEKEFKKWLGNERLKVFSMSPGKRIGEFLQSTIYPVLIVSYEMFLKLHEILHPVRFDLVICDEGHRLKNNGAKTTSMIMGLTSRRRIVLTGTPIQNDLQEFYSLVEFCNPGVLGSYSAFKKVYEEPIVQSRQPTATSHERDIGEARADELKRLTSLFCLRRTQEINKKYLPPKVETVVFCRMSSLQSTLYKHFLNSGLVKSCFRRCTKFSPHLICIGALKKLCNSPSFIYEAALSHGDGVDQPISSTQEERECSPLYMVEIRQIV